MNKLKKLAPVDRIKPLLLDWMVWGYVAYGVVFLSNHFWYREYVDWYGKLTLPWWGLIATAITTFSLAFLGERWGRTIGLKVCKKGGERRKSWLLTHWGIMTLFVVGLTVVVGWITTEIELAVILSRASKTIHLWQGFVNPDFTHFFVSDPALRDTIWGSLVSTLFMAFLATFFGGLLAAPLGFLGARNITGRGGARKIVFYGVRTFFNVVRSVESLLWAIVFALWIGWGPAAGTFALLTHSMAALAKLFSEQVESINRGPIEAVQSTGASFWQIIRYGAVPQVFPQYLAFLLYRLDINVRMATVIALVGGGGIGRFFFYYKDQLDWNQVGAVTLVIVAVVWSLDWISGRAREVIVKGRGRKKIESIEKRVSLTRGNLKLGLNCLIIILFGAALIAALGRINFNPLVLITGFPKTLKLWHAFASPDWSVLGEGITLLIETLYMALMATVLAIPFAFLLSFLGARNLMRSWKARVIYTIVRGGASVVRSIQPIIWAIIFVVWVRTGTFPGMLALWVHSIADLTKLCSERLENIDQGPMEAVEATGARKALVLRYGVIPQIVNPYLAFSLYRLDINVRMATIIGIVGGGGIGMRLYSYIHHWNFPKAVVMTMLIILMVWGIDYTSSRLRDKIERNSQEQYQI